MRTLVDMEGSYLSANFFREIVAAESFSYDPSRPKPQFVTLTGVCRHKGCIDTTCDASITIACMWVWAGG